MIYFYSKNLQTLCGHCVRWQTPKKNRFDLHDSSTHQTSRVQYEKERSMCRNDEIGACRHQTWLRSVGYTCVFAE